MPIIIILSLIICQLSSAKLVELSNDIWKVSIETDNLQLIVEPAKATKTVLSQSVIQGNSKNIELKDNSVNWELPKYKLLIRAELKKNDLYLKISSDKTQTLPIFKHHSDPNHQGYIFPIFEGVYIPADDLLWKETLLEHYPEGDTTKSLSLPMIGIEQKEYILNYIFVNPFNNTFSWSKLDGQLQLSFKHEFTMLDPYSPFELLINLAKKDLLSGAKRYRKTLKDSGKFKSMEEKSIETPDNKKLIGASHIYLWGSTLLSFHDVKNWDKFIAALNLDTIIPNRIKKLFSPETRKILKSKTPLNEHQKFIIVSELDKAIMTIGRNISERVLILEELFEDSIFEKKLWGDGLSVKMIHSLQKSNLKKLWLGFDNWQSGINHPEAIKYAKKLGYLISPYDSLNTIAPNISKNDIYIPYLNNDIHIICKTILKTGEQRSTSDNNSSYMNPICSESYIRNRILKIQQSLQCNSWFLGEGGSGLLLDDYSQKHPLSQKKYAIAINKRLNWIGNNLQIPVGSKNGNAIIAKNLSFAHGMQTPNFSQNDIDMMQKQQSEYFIGELHPEHEPAIFFKASPLKDKYKYIYFNPVFRLPLYQTVFHDSLVTSHHIYFDNFKFPNIRKINTLLHLLYNVPPLYHLNITTIQHRLPTINRVDKFFRPTHEKLATRSLTGFYYLAPDKLTQKITFSDQSVIVANFSDNERKYLETKLPPHSVTAFLNGKNTLQFLAKD